MRYTLYQANVDLARPWRAAARLSAGGLRRLPGGVAGTTAVRTAYATSSMLAETTIRHERPAYGITEVETAAGPVPVSEAVVDTTPFGDLLRFRKAGSAPGPAVLVLAPLSGHFSTLLRDTVRTMLVDHDVYLTDWRNARDVSIAAGRFGVDEHIELIARFLRAIGPGTHLLAVCQPCVQALAVTALMAEADDPCVPSTLTLMAGPIDTRINPTDVNALATSKTLDWFERLTERVPFRYEGSGRRVYPGFLQLTAFLAMNPRRHLSRHGRLFLDQVRGCADEAQSTRDFYDEYFAVMDLTAEFYLETVARVFQTHDLARGELVVRGRVVDPRAIQRTALLTIEGEKDDICSVGQTMAAHGLTPGLGADRRAHHLQAGVGHYGVFSGTRWRREIYPRVRDHIAAGAAREGV